jgi:surface antigen
MTARPKHHLIKTTVFPSPLARTCNGEGPKKSCLADLREAHPAPHCPHFPTLSSCSPSIFQQNIKYFNKLPEEYQSRRFATRPLITILLLLCLVGCGCTYQQRGAAVGGAAGGLTGFLLAKDEKDSTKMAATVAGAMVGGVIGGAVGAYMDRKDKQRMEKALQSAGKNESRSWTNAKTGHAFTIKPLSDVAVDSNGRKYRKATLYGRKKGSKKLDSTTKNFYL